MLRAGSGGLGRGSETPAADCRQRNRRVWRADDFADGRQGGSAFRSCTIFELGQQRYDILALGNLRGDQQLQDERDGKPCADERFPQLVPTRFRHFHLPEFGLLGDKDTSPQTADRRLQSAVPAQILGSEFRHGREMKLVFSTAHVHPGDAFDYWHSVACKHITLHDATPEYRHDFHAELRSGRLGDVTIIEFHNSPMDVCHDRQHIRGAGGRDVFVCRQLAGRMRIEQLGREVLLNAGDMTLLDPLRPYVSRFFSGSRMLVLKVPRKLLEIRIGKVHDVVAQPLDPAYSETGLTSLFLGLLPAHAGNLGPPAAAMVGDQALDLLAVSIAKTIGGPQARLSSARSFVRFNLRIAIETRLADRALDPAGVAAAAGVSVRYANAILAEEGTSIARLIQARRLARCGKALADPVQARRTIREIALGWGFSDMTHFGRRFRLRTHNQ
jgi:AraC family transcriptional regulator, positive regulator of tynA and feaB